MRNEHALWLENLPAPGYDASRCAWCGGKTRVDGKTVSAAGFLTRYRVCMKCGKRCKTAELIAIGNAVSFRPAFDKEEQHEQSFSDRQPDKGP